MIRTEAQKRIEKLKKAINHHRYLYHVLDRQEISSAALDSLKKELFDLEEEFPDLVTADSPSQRIGGEPRKQFKKIRHSTPMLSINDAFSKQDVENWLERDKKLLTEKEISEIDYFCELKLDGLAVELVYKDGVLLSASTRGDGLVGEEVTFNIKTIEAIPLKLLSDGVSREEMIVRGEVFISKKAFDEANQSQEKAGLARYANPRNLAAGSIRQLDPKVTAKRNLDFFAYDLVTDLGAETHEQKHEILKAMGFKVNPHSCFCRDLKAVFDFFEKIRSLREKLGYEIDGIVINVNSNQIFKKLSAVGKAPRGVLALKFALKQAATIVKDVKIQVGRTGVLTPIAVLQPIEVGGVIVSRATLHNHDEIKRLGLRVGDTVIVGRAGDVIPDIVSVLPEMRSGREKMFKMPQECPVCGEKIVRPEGEVAVRCPNPDCPARERRYFYHFVSKQAFDIVGLGPKIVDQLLDQGIIQDPADLFVLESGDLLPLERFDVKSAENLIASIRARKIIPLPRFIFALGIRNIGEQTAQDLANIFDSLAKLKTASLEELESISDIGPKGAQSIYSWFRNKKNLEFLDKLEGAGVKAKAGAANHEKRELSGKTFVFTGSFSSVSREQIKQNIRQLGGRVADSVSRKTDFLVVGDNPGSKLREAKRLGVNVVFEPEFLKMLMPNKLWRIS